MKRMSSTDQQEAFPKVLRVGQTAYICVYARSRWNDSDVDVVSGQAFAFSVPTGEEWTDWRRTCGADGYASIWIRRCEFLRRVPEARWLQLIGTIGRSIKHPVIIGSRLADFLPPYPGRLYLFANDVPWMYWNNRGMISVRITRTK